MSPTAVTPDQFSTFGDLVKHLRRQAHLTQMELAMAVGYSDAQISRIEKNQRTPDAATITALFVPALGLENDSKWMMRLLELAKDKPQLPSDNSQTNSTPHNLPHQLTSFIGREKEIAEVTDLLKAHHLVTLTGPGGTGKTRLSLQVVSDLLAFFPDGVRLIEFASISEPTLVAFEVTNWVGLKESSKSAPSVTKVLVEYFRSRKALLIFDNCEHLIEPIAHLADLLTQSCRDVVILATSRETLGVKGEIAYAVPPLNIPDSKSDLSTLMDSESGRLFVERASAASTSFSLTQANASTIAQICLRLDGIPLALELAAARIKMMTVDEIVKRLNDRFQLLKGGARTTIPRQQTLRSMIDWSYNLLSEQEKILFRRLAVFVGGWTLEAAEAVCGGEGSGDPESHQILDLLSQLVNKSLVLVETRQAESRYHFLETIRQYALEQLSEAEEASAMRAKHLAYFVKLAEEAEPELYRSDQIVWVNKLDDELDNLRLALEWAIAADAKAGMRLLVSLVLYWNARINPQECDAWLNRLLEQYHAADSLRARALAYRGLILTNLGKFNEARASVNQGLELSRSISDQSTEAYSLYILGVSFWQRGDFEQGVPIMKQSLALYEAVGDKLGQATTLMRLVGSSDYEASKAYMVESIRLQRELGNLSGLAFSLYYLSIFLILHGDFSSPLPMAEEALSIFQRLGNSVGEANALTIYGYLAFFRNEYQDSIAYVKKAIELNEKNGDLMPALYNRRELAMGLLHQGDMEEAKELLHDCVIQFQKLNAFDGLAKTIETVASLFVRQEDPVRAALLIAWAGDLRQKSRSIIWPMQGTFIDEILAKIHTMIDETKFAELSTQGRTMTMEAAIALALEGIHKSSLANNEIPAGKKPI
ncbi:MAG: helix-turn-helix domain-containing protein [Anaerolineales bacterium]|nr:MAG: helix-turn-helix domain-containing protein [Anaerolineales bacterium]